jgi:hypothetical protein
VLRVVFFLVYYDFIVQDSHLFRKFLAALEGANHTTHPQQGAGLPPDSDDEDEATPGAVGSSGLLSPVSDTGSSGVGDNESRIVALASLSHYDGGTTTTTTPPRRTPPREKTFSPEAEAELVNLSTRPASFLRSASAHERAVHSSVSSGYGSELFDAADEMESRTGGSPPIKAAKVSRGKNNPYWRASYGLNFYRSFRARWPYYDL